MPKILHTYRYTGRPWEILQSVVPEGYTIKTLDTPTYEQLVKEAGDADYFLVSGRLPIDKGVLDAAKKLKMIPIAIPKVQNTAMAESSRMSFRLLNHSTPNADKTEKMAAPRIGEIPV